MSTRPNIFVFFTDQQRWDTCGCYNSNLNLTPNLDRLAAGGVRFDKAYTCQPVCGPARSALQSGLYPTENNHFHNLAAFDPACCTPLAEYFNRAGYDTGYVGKLHLAMTTDGPVPEEKRLGYKDYWRAVDVVEWASMPYEGHVYDENNKPVYYKDQYRPDFFTDLAIDYLRGRDQANPFFMFLSVIEPHQQNCLDDFIAPEGYAERYRDAWVPEDLAGRPGQGDWEKCLPGYYGAIARLDENLGRLEAALKETGQWDNTILLFTSDHGCHFRTRNSEYKRCCHEAATRIPFVVCGPGVRKGYAEQERLASLIDLPATVLDLAGIPVPEYYRGLSLAPILRGEADIPWRSEVFIQISESQVGRALCDGRYKYSVSAPDLNGYEVAGSHTYSEEFLYDLEADPSEGNNLVRDPALADLRARLQKRLISHIEKIEHLTPVIHPA